MVLLSQSSDITGTVSSTLATAFSPAAIAEVASALDVTTVASSVAVLQVKSFTVEVPSNQRRLPVCRVRRPETGRGGVTGMGAGVATGGGGWREAA